MVSENSVPAVDARLIRRLVRKANLDGTAYVYAMRVAGIHPGIAQWQRFVNSMLLAMGLVMVLAGVVVLCIYYWPQLHRFGKFAVIEVGMLLSLILSWRFGLSAWPGKMCTTVAALLLGFMLTVISAQYLTGADSYQIYVTWALLILPWTLIADFLVLWLLFVMLLQVGLLLYWQLDVLITPFYDPAYALSATAVNGAFLVIWEVASYKGVKFIVQSWFPRLLVSATVVVLTVPLVYWYFVREMPLNLVEVDSALMVLFFVYLFYIVAGSAYYCYLVSKSDLFNLSIFMLSLITVTSIFCLRVLSQFVQQEQLILLILGLLILSQVSLATGWLLRTAKRAIL